MGDTRPCGPMRIFFGSVIVPCAQDLGIPIWFIWDIPDPVYRYSPFSIPMANRSIFAKIIIIRFQILVYISFAAVQPIEKKVFVC